MGEKDDSVEVHLGMCVIETRCQEAKRTKKNNEASSWSYPWRALALSFFCFMDKKTEAQEAVI